MLQCLLTIATQNLIMLASVIIGTSLSENYKPYHQLIHFNTIVYFVNNVMYYMTLLILVGS